MPARMLRSAGWLLVVLLLAGMAATPALAQYFGRNKVQYDQFDFKVFRTEHFEIYYYPEEQQAAEDMARMAERWYRRHSRTYLREFKERKPIILYANDADFQQTNAIGGLIGQGTGGVTESLKERVVMPLTGIYAENDHVLGHELVHSFQYDIALSQEDTTRFALNALPLWLIEGTAEYLSVGRVDPHTAMWLRDSALRDDLPTADQLTRDMRYFPYRFGQAYMAYVGGKYGDAAVANLFKLGGRIGLDSAFVYTIGIDADSLSKEWIQAVKDAYLPLTVGRVPVGEAGRLVVSKQRGGGNINIAPSLSPDGKYVAFLSELDLFNINLFIADTETGQIVKRLKGTTSNPHFDAIRFINSSGSWSPDGKRFAFVTFVEGNNEIAIVDVDSREIERRIAVEGVGALSNPAWSPDGRTIAFSGLDGGISDLYLLDVESRVVRQLTDDRYADLQPTWSPDGQTLAFVTDRGPGGTNFETLEYAPMRLGLLSVAGGEPQVRTPLGDEVAYYNPQFGPDGRSLFFISDFEGFKDVYRLDLATDATHRVTNLQTGVSGITGLSPALSVAAQSGRMVFSVFSDNEYSLYALEQDQTAGTPIASDAGARAVAAILPPRSALGQGLVGNYLDDPLTGLPERENFRSQDYRARLKLDYIAPPTLGVSAGGPFGTRVGGGVGFFFSDMLGNHNLGVVAQANGTLKDVGAQVSYLNQKHRLNWGVSGGHIPLLYGGAYSYLSTDPETGQLVQVVEQQIQRIYIDEANGLAAYPFSTTRRVELSGGFVRYGFDYEVERYYLYPGYGTRRERVSLDELEPDPVYLGQASAAFVGDYSNFGFTSPVQGGRYRFQVTPLIGTSSFVSVLGDYRRYFFQKPFTFAVRGLHVGNYGAKLNELFGAQYLGYTYYPGFVRGYSFNSFEPSECTPTEGKSCPEFQRLQGTRIALTSAEIRIPFLGTHEFGLINFPYLPTELTLFTDAGLAWTAEEAPVLKFDRRTTERVPVVSVGASARVNLLGYLVFEIFYAYPFQRPEKGGHFGLQLMPGW